MRWPAITVVTLLAACGREPAPPAPTEPVVPTFTKDIAPIVYTHCATCHRPDESGPFDLLTYDDVRKRARQIADVTADGFMPPWLPEAGYGDFLGERRLTAEQVALIRHWAEGGAPEGDPADLPARPVWTEGWQLGEPDLVITLPEAYTLPAEGVDVFRNFVLPFELPMARFVRALELRPGNKRIVHHAIVMVDPTRLARGLDEAEPGPGYEGMDAVRGFAPDGHFLGWTPGRVADEGEDGIPWRLEPGTDFVLQLHMLPSGKPESIQPAIGLYFGAAPQGPERNFTLYMKADADVDIPAGEPAFRVTENFVLPVEATLERVYPHAHYLGKSIQAFATRPDGRRVWMIRIDDWDFNWQDAYRCAPVTLPRGTTLTMQWTYDNSADNIRNPHSPPRRVRGGNRTTDEMAHLYLQFRVADEAAVQAMSVADLEHRLAGSSASATLLTQLAGALQSADRLEEAGAHAMRALELEPDHAPAHFCLAVVYERVGRLDEAAYCYGEAARLEPDNPLMRVSLAEVMVRQGRLADAERQVRRALEIDPRIGDAYVVLGDVRRREGRFDEAADEYGRAMAIRPDDVRPHTYLAVIRTQEGRFDDAVTHLRRAIEIDPRQPALHSSLGRVLLAMGRTDAAVECFRAALAIDPAHAEARQYLEATVGRR